MGVELLKDFCSFPTALYNIWDNLVLILAFKIVFQELYTERSDFFFQASGQDKLTADRVPVRDSDSRTPLRGTSINDT